MGGESRKTIDVCKSLVDDYIQVIAQEDVKRACEVSSFYIDLENSIKNVARSIVGGGKSIYIVGNRTVKKQILPTDQFIAECFEKNGFKHLITYERVISNKRMPKLNSPSNIPGEKIATMNTEFIVVCENS